MSTFALFTDEKGSVKGPEFTVAEPTYERINAVCEVMCRRSDLTDDELVYYAEMGNIEPKEVDKKTFQKSWEFKHRPYGKATYIGALLPLLFIDGPLLTDTNGKIKDADAFKSLNYKNARAGLDFFFNSFGETLHDVAMYSDLQKITPELANLLTMIKPFKDGDDKHGEA